MRSEDKKVGILEGKFYPCPETPNCVSTQAPKEDETHYIEPFKYQSSSEEAKDKIVKIIKNTKRTKIVKESEDYIHAVFKTFLFRFKDDVEFYIDEESKTIHFKSQSRIGYSDLGKNRKRMEKIRSKFEK